VPAVDIYEDAQKVVLKLEVPGIDEKDLDIRVENHTLTVKGERKFEKPKRRSRTSIASSGAMAASSAPSRCPPLWTRRACRPATTPAC
jgi:HSP20 family molecular chaperone IbpA